MNVAISTFARQGYLLTALAVAVLVFASSGTAWAQTISIRASSSTLQESASTDPATPDPVTVTITRSGTDTVAGENPGEPRQEIFDSNEVHLNIRAEYNGRPIADGNGAGSFGVSVATGTVGTLTGDLSAAGGTATLQFVDDPNDADEKVEKVIRLTITDTADQGDWDSEKLTLTLTPGAGLDEVPNLNFTRTTTLTINDDDPAPKLRFSKDNIQLAKGNKQQVVVGMGVGAGGAGDLPGEANDTATVSIHGKLASLDGDGAERGESMDHVLLSVSPADAVGPADAAGGIISITKVGGPNNGRLETDGQGRYIVGTIADAVSATGDLTLEITAKDASGFRDENITLMLMEGRTMARIDADGGGIDDADPAMVTILSGEETPTVTFSTEAIDIDEGDSETVYLLADTDQGSEVGSATVRVSGDALISLSQGGSSISGGTVSFDGSANAELTITALMDRELEDGEEKMATVTITDASGANVGDPRAVTVTVVGATAVPALPLIGQLLLALFLMAGGSRLYRRRQK